MPCKSTASRKAKGRRLQQLVRDNLRILGCRYGLHPSDIESRGMGQNGVDIIITAAGLNVLPLDIECKNNEALNVTNTFWEHYDKYRDTPNLKLLVSSKNHRVPIVTMSFEAFLDLYEAQVRLNKQANGQKEKDQPEVSATRS